MDEKKLRALEIELAKGLKAQIDINQFSRMLTKLIVETVLNSELTDRPGDEKMHLKRLTHLQWPLIKNSAV